MWKKITEIKDMERFAFLRNDYGCSVNYTAEKIKHNIENKIDCEYFIYDDPRFKILLGFKYHQKYKKLTLMTASRIVDNTDDYAEIGMISALKVKEMLIEKNVNSLMKEYNWEELESTNLSIGRLGYWEFMKLFKEQAEKIGLKVEFDKNKIVIRL